MKGITFAARRSIGEYGPRFGFASDMAAVADLRT
jgi:hypothetical protein